MRFGSFFSDLVKVEYLDIGVTCEATVVQLSVAKVFLGKHSSVCEKKITLMTLCHKLLLSIFQGGAKRGKGWL